MFIKKFHNYSNSDSSCPVNLVVIHGGPGLNTHEDLLSALIPSVCEKLEMSTTVTFYDQLGCGSSDKPNDADCYSMDSFVSHLSQILCGLDRVVLFGYSFGGQIAMEWLCSAYADNVIGLIISNSPLDESSYAAKNLQIRQDSGQEMHTYQDKEEDEEMANGSIESLVYATLIGQGESRITGSMRDWSVTERIIPALERIKIPALFVSGNFDTIPFKEYEILRGSAEVEIIPDTTHVPFFEKRDIFWSAVNKFLKRV